LADPGFPVQNKAHPTIATMRDHSPWAIVCWVVVLSIAYGSLLPFSFSTAAIQRDGVRAFLSLHLADGTIEDVLANLGVYFPLGLFAALSVHAGRYRGLRGLGFGAASGAVLSLTCEFGQVFLSSRVPSWTDVGSNVSGALAGAVMALAARVAFKATEPRIRARYIASPFQATTTVLVFGLFSYHLAPFDFVTTSDALHASFGHSLVDPLAVRPATSETFPLAGLVSELGSAAWFLVLGYASALANRSLGRHPIVAFGSAVKHGVVLVVLVELMQIFTQSHVFDLGSILLESLGVVFGAWMAIFLIDVAVGEAWSYQPSLAVPTGVLMLLAFVQVALLFAPGLVHGATWSAERWANWSIAGLPFEKLWRGSMAAASCELLSKATPYAVLTLVLAMIRERSRLALPYWGPAAAVFLIALGVDALRIPAVGEVDLTGTILAAYSAAGVLTLLPRIPTGNRPALRIALVTQLLRIR